MAQQTDRDLTQIQLEVGGRQNKLKQASGTPSLRLAGKPALPGLGGRSRPLRLADELFAPRKLKLQVRLAVFQAGQADLDDLFRLVRIHGANRH